MTVLLGPVLAGDKQAGVGDPGQVGQGMPAWKAWEVLARTTGRWAGSPASWGRRRTPWGGNRTRWRRRGPHRPSEVMAPQVGWIYDKQIMQSWPGHQLAQIIVGKQS